MSRRSAPLAFALLIAACGRDEPSPPQEPVELPPVQQPRQLTPPAPSEPDGLLRDRSPVSEAPFSADSAQGAANTLQTYYALIEAGKYDDAFALREQGARGPTREQFAASFARYADYHANVGKPSEIAAAAGSLYVEVPVQTYGRFRNGRPFSSAGTVTLRRSNAARGEWRIYSGR